MKPVKIKDGRTSCNRILCDSELVMTIYYVTTVN